MFPQDVNDKRSYAVSPTLLVASSLLFNRNFFSCLGAARETAYLNDDNYHIYRKTKRNKRSL